MKFAHNLFAAIFALAETVVPRTDIARANFGRPLIKKKSKVYPEQSTRQANRANRRCYNPGSARPWKE